jgi:uncharacterized protein YecT (DUF1311 family)
MKLAALLAIVLASTALAVAQTSRPDDPCRKVSSQRELNDCTEKKFHAADDELQKLYRTIAAQLDNKLAKLATGDVLMRKYAASAVADLRSAQDAWVTYRDLQCKAEGGREAGGSIQPTIFADCMQRITRDRIQQLHDTYDDNSDDK